MKKIKRIKLLVVIEIIALLVCGCRIRYEPSEYGNPAVEQGEIIIKAVIDKKTEPIKALFCPYIIENHPDLENEIRGMFEFMDGDIISYDEPFGDETGFKTDAKEGRIEEAISCEIKNVKTSTGRTYRIGCGAFTKFKKYPQYIGVTDITVFDEDLHDSEAGYPEEAIYRIYSSEMWEDII